MRELHGEVLMNKKQILELLGAPKGASVCSECGGLSYRYRSDGPCPACNGLGYWRADQWFTPPEIIEAARDALGGFIDLDPFSCAEANGTVRAIKYYDLEDDGFAQTWHGRVFVNWPGQNVRSAAKVIEQIPHVECMIVHLFNCDTSTGWFHDLMAQRPQICLLQGRVKHGRPGGSVPGGGDRPSAVLGFNVPQFPFDDLGVCLEPV